MVTTRSMARNQKNIVPWSDLNHDVLYSVMMRLGVIEFLSFSGVCKSWRSLAVSNRKTFMASKPPMFLSYEKADCYLEDFEGRKFKTTIPELVGRTCVAISCGYLILLGLETRDFWLVNPVTRHQLHFPDIPQNSFHPDGSFEVRTAILVFSPSINGWVFAMLTDPSLNLWFSIAGKGAWDCVSAAPSIFLEMHAFKGKIYTLNCNYNLWEAKYVYELRFDPVPILSLNKLALPDTLFTHPRATGDIISSDENLYLMEYTDAKTYNPFKLDFDQLNCVPCEKSTQEYAFFTSMLKFTAAVKSGPWAASLSSYWGLRFPHMNNPGKGRLYIAERWYFPHQCLDVSILDE